MQKRLQRKLCLLRADAGLEPSVCGHPTQSAATVLEPVRVRRHLRLHHDGNENIRGDAQFHAVEVWLRNSDHSHRVAIQRDGSPHDVAVAVEVASPEAVAEHHDRLAVGNGVVVRGDGAPKYRLDAQYLEICAGDQLSGDLHCMVAVANGYACWEPAKHPGKDLVVVAQIFKHRPGNRVGAVTVAVMVTGLADDHKPFWIADRQEPQNHLVQQAEHRRVCADSERQSRDSYERKSRAFRQRPNPIANILHEPVQPDSRANIADALYDLIDPSCLATSIAMRLFGIHAGLRRLGRYQFNIGPEFLFEVAIELVSAEQIVPKRAESTDHKASYVVRKAVAMAREIRSHRSDSVCSCFFPALVNE